jgi:hypothetical protein
MLQSGSTAEDGSCFRLCGYCGPYVLRMLVVASCDVYYQHQSWGRRVCLGSSCSCASNWGGDGSGGQLSHMRVTSADPIITVTCLTCTSKAAIPCSAVCQLLVMMHGPCKACWTGCSMPLFPGSACVLFCLRQFVRQRCVRAVYLPGWSHGYLHVTGPADCVLQDVVPQRARPLHCWEL